jgi:hypothetical protein
MTDLPHDSDPTGSIAEAQHRAVHAAILSTLRAVAPRPAIEAAHDLLTATSWTMWAELGRLVVEWDDEIAPGWGNLRCFAFWAIGDNDEPYLGGPGLKHGYVLDVLDAVRNTASHLTGWLAENSAPTLAGSCAESLPGVSASPTLTPGTDSIDLDVIDLRGL